DGRVRTGRRGPRAPGGRALVLRAVRAPPRGIWNPDPLEPPFETNRTDEGAFDGRSCGDDMKKFGPTTSCVPVSETGVSGTHAYRLRASRRVARCPNRLDSTAFIAYGRPAAGRRHLLRFALSNRRRDEFVLRCERSPSALILSIRG